MASLLGRSRPLIVRLDMSVVGEEIAPVELREPEPSTRTADNVMIMLVKLAQFRPIRGLVDLVPNPTSPKLTFDGIRSPQAYASCKTICRSFEECRSLDLSYLSVKQTAGSEPEAKGQCVCPCIPQIKARV